MTPVDQVLEIDGSTAATSLYTAVGTFEDGSTADISHDVQWSLSEGTLGVFADNRFTSTLDQGGQVRVSAQRGVVQAETGLELRIKKRYTDPGASGLPVDPAAPFNGPADASRTPDLVYPNDGVLLPPNLRLLEIHFLPGAGNTLFELSLRESAHRHQGLHALHAADERRLHLHAGRDGVAVDCRDQPRRRRLVVTVRGTDDAGTGVGASATSAHGVQPTRTSRAASTTGRPRAAPPATRRSCASTSATSRRPRPRRFVGPEQAGGKCVGCHALSRDGKKMVASAGGWDVEDILLVDVETATRVATPVQTAFASWNPDGSKYVGVFATRDRRATTCCWSTTPGLLGTIAVGATAAQSTSHPDWSPDGSRIAFVRAGQAYESGVNNQRFYRGAIEMVEAQGASFSSPIDRRSLAGGEKPLLPVVRAGQQPARVQRVDLPGGQRARRLQRRLRSDRDVLRDQADGGVHAGQPRARQRAGQDETRRARSPTRGRSGHRSSSSGRRRRARDSCG